MVAELQRKFDGKVSKGAKIRNPYYQVPHLTQDTNGKVINLQLDMTNESKEVSPFQAGEHKAYISRCIFKVTYFNILHLMLQQSLTPISVFENKRRDNIKSGSFMFCQCSFCLFGVFIFLT